METTRVITTEQVKTELVALATIHRDRTDARVERQLAPRYVEHGQPCCLVAHILHRLGFSIAQLRQLDTEVGTQGGGVILDQSRHPLLRRISPDALALLAYVQKRQDMDESWGTVANRALQRGQFAPGYEGRQRGSRYDKAARAWTSDVFAWNQPPPHTHRENDSP